MPIRLIGAMLYLGTIDSDSRIVSVPFLSPLTMDEESAGKYRQYGKLFVPQLQPITCLLVLAGTHPEPTFRLNINVLIPNADHQSQTFIKPWSDQGFAADRIDLIVRNVLIDGTFDAIPVRILIDGSPIADLAIPLRLPVDQQG